MTKLLNQATLRQFTGSENFYRHAINREAHYTDGAKYVANQAGAYWLLEEIAIIQPIRTNNSCCRGSSRRSRRDRDSADRLCRLSRL
jgi:hypothetical protein